MKKITLAMATILYILSGCSVLKKSVTLTDPVRLNVFAITRPVSEQIPGTKRLFRGSDGRNHSFTLTDLQIEGGQVVSVYLIDEAYQKLQDKIDITERQLKLKKKGDKVTGYVFSAQSLEGASVIPKSEFKKFNKSDREVVKTFQNTRKYIVWSWVGSEVTFSIGDNGAIDFSSLENSDNKKDGPATEKVEEKSVDKKEPEKKEETKKAKRDWGN